MMGALNIGLSGMLAAQTGMDVTSHNIANVHTDGYKRQVVDLVEVSYPTASHSIFGGAGVAVANIRTTEDPFLDKLLYGYASDRGKDATALDGLNKLNDILSKNNLVSASQSVLNSFQNVANNPTSVAVRESLMTDLNNFKNTATNLDYQLNELGNQLNNQETTLLDNTNSLLQSIANLNNRINVSGDTSSLNSQKNSLLNKLSENLSFNIINDGKTIISESGKVLVDGNKATNLTLNDINQLKGGNFGGINITQGILGDIQGKLPGAVNTFITQVDTMHKQGYDLNGNQGKNVFGSYTTLSDIKLNITDPREIAASATSVPGIYNGKNAQEISDLRYKFFNHQTVFDQMNELGSKVAALQNQYKNDYNSANSLYQNAKSSALSNVNLDEEGVNLLKYQRMYEANAKVIQTANEMLGTLLSIKA